jgi:hypothetical protein
MVPWGIRRPGAAIAKFLRSDDFPSRTVVLAVLVGGVALTFWQQLVGAALFIGESDRLNSYLNMRLAEYDARRAYGRIPAWNPAARVRDHLPHDALFH